MSALISTERETDRRREAATLRVLFIGSALVGAPRIFRRDNDPVNALHCETSARALELMERSGAGDAIDCVMIDQREGMRAGHQLQVVALAAAARRARLVVLVSPDQRDAYDGTPGVDALLVEPVAPLDIIRTMMDQVDEKKAAIEAAEGKPDEAIVAEPATPTDRGTGEQDEAIDGPRVTTGFETTLSRIEDADRKLWSRFVPIANFVYKKAAVGVLTSLFAAFFLYGCLIVFFMVSGSWSVPMELSRGHALVEKAQRDLSSLRVRRNAVATDLDAARSTYLRAQRDEADAKSASALTMQAIREELSQQGRAGDDLRDHIRRLKEVIQGFTQDNGSDFAKEMERAYSQRLITRRQLNGATMQVLETMHRLSIINNELAAKKLEFAKVRRRVEYLESLVNSFDEEQPRLVVSAGSDLVHFAQDLIRSKNRMHRARKELLLAETDVVKLSQSIAVLDGDIAALEKSPVGRALEEPVVVLFVPYANRGSYEKGTALAACSFQIVWCRTAGVAGATIEGEATAVHPLFGKPVRGLFVEAELSDRTTITEELFHAGRAPLFL